MNAINEVINFEEIVKSCRVFNPNETMLQLRMQPMKFMCWGATKFTVDNMRNPKMLRFYVSGMKHKGHVYIFLNGMDLYDVYITTTKGTIIDKSDDMGLYFDQLTDWIDNRIEKTERHAW
ncbi:MAG: hypothetical protein JW735_13505 [Prolixibacteraceae bacterium]|nr:hypothetical protein [Prolixibacteraceae bacterium]